MNTKFYTIQIEVNTKTIKKWILRACKCAYVAILIAMFHIANLMENDIISIGNALIRTIILVAIIVGVLMIHTIVKEDE